MCLRVRPRRGSKTFADADLGDARRTRRRIASAAAIAAHPEKPFTQVFDWGPLKGFYRVCNRETATVTAIPTPHWNRTRRAIGQHPLVLIRHDTTERDLTTHPALDGTGPIGNGTGRGFLPRNRPAVVPEPRQALGRAYPPVELRRWAPDREAAAQRRERESTLWVRAIEASGRPPAGSRWVDVGDRRADIHEAMSVSRELGHAVLFRVARDRQVWPDESRETPVTLRDYAGSLASQGDDEVAIPAARVIR